MGVVADEVGFDQVVRDPLVLGRAATRCGEDGANQTIESVVGDDQEETLFVLWWFWLAMRRLSLIAGQRDSYKRERLR